jgi:hypothetical protein
LTVRGIYFSFWPDSRAGKKHLKTKRSQAGSLMQIIDDDIRAEDMVLPKTYELSGLNEGCRHGVRPWRAGEPAALPDRAQQLLE